MKILEKLLLRKQHKQEEMLIKDRIEPTIENIVDEIAQSLIARPPRLGQFPSPEFLARKIKAEMMKKAQAEFALVMDQLNQSIDPME